MIWLELDRIANALRTKLYSDKQYLSTGWSPGFEEWERAYRAAQLAAPSEFEKWRAAQVEEWRAPPLSPPPPPPPRPALRKPSPPPPHVCGVECWRKYLKNPNRTLAVMLAREGGATLTAIGKQFGCGPERIRQILLKGERKRKHASKKLWLRAHASRPIDMGGPRGVWMEFRPTLDPRFDFMEPIAAR